MRIPKRNLFKPDETSTLVALILAIGVVVSVALYVYTLSL